MRTMVDDATLEHDGESRHSDKPRRTGSKGKRRSGAVDEQQLAEVRAQAGADAPDSGTKQLSASSLARMRRGESLPGAANLSMSIDLQRVRAAAVSYLRLKLFLSSSNRIKYTGGCDGIS